jgi:hypothetical protein
MFIGGLNWETTEGMCNIHIIYGHKKFRRLVKPSIASSVNDACNMGVQWRPASLRLTRDIIESRWVKMLIIERRVIKRIFLTVRGSHRVHSNERQRQRTLSWFWVLNLQGPEVRQHGHGQGALPGQ